MRQRSIKTISLAMMRDNTIRLPITLTKEHLHIFYAAIFVAVQFLLPLSTYAQSNLGKNFRVSFPLGAGNPERTIPNYPSCIVNIISPRQTSATVEYQGQLPFQINLNTYWTKIIVPDSIVNNKKAIYITSQDSIAIFPVDDDDGSVCAYNAMPMEQWGTRYIVPTLAFDTLNSTAAVGYLLPGDDSTHIISVIPGYYDDTVFAVSRDTISVARGSSITAGSDITVTALKPIGILDQLAQEGWANFHTDYYEDLIEPLSPEARWGTEYYSSPPPSWANSMFPSDGQYRLHITAAFDSTIVR
ncbi:MAG TPA: hypothetical protein VFA55_06210, partial [Candidatus Kapabacteria bacterium]|nr:hypothetical protein [Candidatus Kapabacteria bacterium]